MSTSHLYLRACQLLVNCSGKSPQCAGNKGGRLLGKQCILWLSARLCIAFKFLISPIHKDHPVLLLDSYRMPLFAEGPAWQSVSYCKCTCML